MSLSYISSTFDNNSAGLGNAIAIPSVAAVLGDKILLVVEWRNKVETLTTPQWNSESFTQIGSTIDTGEASLGLYELTTASSATSDITGAFSNFVYYNSSASVVRSSTVSTINRSSISQQIYNSGTFSSPSLTVSSVPSGALLLDVLAAMAWEIPPGYNPVPLVTWSPDSPATSRSQIVNAASAAINILALSTSAGGGADITTAWTPSASEPMYTHLAMYFTEAASQSIDSVETDSVSGLVVGEAFAVSTTGLGALTSFNVKTLATPAATTNAISLSAPSGDGTGVMKQWVNEEYYPFPGTVTVTVSDGVNSPTNTFPLSIPSNFLSVEFASVVISNDTYLGNALNEIGHPLANDDLCYYENTNGLVIGANSSVICNNAMTTIIYIHKVSGIIEQYTLRINDAGQITGINKITTRGITRQHITS